MICLDSSFLIDYLKGKPEARQAYEEYEHEGLATTEMNIFEVSIGYFHHVKMMSKDALFLSFIDFINTISILPMTNLFAIDAAAHYATLLKKGKPIGVTDCLIAGIMQANGVKKILTNNKKHFSKIQGIEAITYS